MCERERKYDTSTNPANKFKNIHAIRKNIDTVAMLTHDALLRHFRKVMYHGGNRRLHTFTSYVSWNNVYREQLGVDITFT